MTAVVYLDVVLMILEFSCLWSFLVWSLHCNTCIPANILPHRKKKMIVYMYINLLVYTGGAV